VTLATFLQPGWFAVLVAWNFLVLSAAQLTIRLIMAFSVRLTLLAALTLSIAALLVAAVYDMLVGQPANFTVRLGWVPVSMILMALFGFGSARWQLRIRRLRGQIIAGCMVGLLDPHVFTLLFS
jgi:hypothetical protein